VVKLCVFTFQLVVIAHLNSYSSWQLVSFPDLNPACASLAV